MDMSQNLWMSHNRIINVLRFFCRYRFIGNSFTSIILINHDDAKAANPIANLFNIGFEYLLFIKAKHLIF